MKFQRNYFFFLTTLNFIFLGCSSLKPQNNSEVVDNNPAPSVRIQSHLVDEDLPKCQSCLLGVMSDEDLKKSDSKIYFLHGAEHLNLDNYYFDIPVVYNDATKKWIDYFTGRGRELFARYTMRSGRYTPVLSKILNDQGLPRDLIFLSMAESGFQNHARSWAKAVGPWQFMPFTGKRYGLEIDFFKDERRDPLKATVAASMYLRDLFEEFQSWELAMSAYNAGEGKIRRAKRIYNTSSFWEMRKGRYLKAETKNYVPKIMALAIIGKNLKAFGFTDITFDNALDYHEVVVPGNTDLYKIAQYIGEDFEVVKKYNPELVRWQTPPKVESYNLRIPVSAKPKWDEITEKNLIAQNYKQYKMNGAGTLANVADKFKVPSSILAEINQMNANQKLVPGALVLLPFRDDHAPERSHLYSDLYEKPRRSIAASQSYNSLIRSGLNQGKIVNNPREFYVVKKGDTLWHISKRTGVNINTLIRTNSHIVKSRQILPGDKLAIR